MEYINLIKQKLSIYRQEFIDIYREFSSSSIDSFSKEYNNYVENTDVIVYILSNNVEMNET